MDGGGLAMDSKGTLHSAWRRDGVVYSTTGQGEEIALGKGKNPSISAGTDGRYVIWTDGMRVMLSRPGAPKPVDLGMGAFPILAGSGPIYAAWEHHGSITVEQIP